MALRIEIRGRRPAPLLDWLYIFAEANLRDLLVRQFKEIGQQDDVVLFCWQGGNRLRQLVKVVPCRIPQYLFAKRIKGMPCVFFRANEVSFSHLPSQPQRRVRILFPFRHYYGDRQPFFQIWRKKR